MELNDILKWQGIELPENATSDDYKKAFEERYLLRESAINDTDIEKHFAGKLTFNWVRDLNKTAKENGIELTPEEKEKSPYDIARILIAKKQESYESKIEELTKNRKPTEEYTSLQEKYGQLQKRYEEEVGAKTELQKAIEAKEKEVTTFKRDFTLNEAKKTIFNSLTFSDNANDLLKKGFNATVAEKYNILLDDSDSPIITDKNGNRIKDPNKHGSFLSPVDVLTNELNAAGLGKVVSTEKFPTPQKQEYKRELDNNGVKIAPRAKPMTGY